MIRVLRIGTVKKKAAAFVARNADMGILGSVEYERSMDLIQLMALIYEFDICEDRRKHNCY